MALTHVCDDVNGNTVWMYDASDQKYIRYTRQQEVAGIIAGQYLPDPDFAWEQRCKHYGVSKDSPEALLIKPQAATYSLWNHWKTVS